jgi:general secretion pathway protein G
MVEGDMKSARRNPAGFTLIELLLVMVIIGILAAIVVPNFANHRIEAERKAAKANLDVFKTALNSYAVDNGRYPTTEQGLDALVIKPTSGPEPRNWKGPYLMVVDLPVDPWGHAYRYINPGSLRPPLFDLYSVGEDGQEGTEDDIRAF